MLYTFRFEGKKYAYDSVSGAIVQPSALEYKMMGAILPPLTPVCPTSLRYELAKYDSLDVEDAYNTIYSLFEQGVLYGSEDGAVRIRTEGEYAFTSPAMIAAALNEAFAKAESPIAFAVVGGQVEETVALAKEAATRLGKTIC
ncbi:MAG: hypothetical protein IKV00_01680 [Clostridia bacterium]|nr:hypothetical protein [Clostridia bacterium]